MMRKLFWIGTVLFWLAVLTLAAVVWLTPPAPMQLPQKMALTVEEVARHSSEQDCWMVISGTVYDISAYVPEHPSKPSILLPWCGKEATQAYQTKTKGRTHSPQADQQLAQFAIGFIQMGASQSGK